MTSRELDTSTEASGPHAFAIRERAPSSEAQPASIASSPASVTIAIRPSSGVDGRGYRSDLGPASRKNSENRKFGAGARMERRLALWQPGWFVKSSGRVARQAHNLKVIGSNPIRSHPLDD